MRDNLPNMLRAAAKEWRKEYKVVATGATRYDAALDEAADAIEELSQPRWIPVTERLPEAERKSYWVCTDTGYQCECRWTNNRFGIRELDEWGWSIFDIPQYQKVVAWMPLPKPYEPPKEET